MVAHRWDNPRRARLRSGESAAMVRGASAAQSWRRLATIQSEVRVVNRPIPARNSEWKSLMWMVYTTRVVRNLNFEARSGSSVLAIEGLSDAAIISAAPRFTAG